MATNRCANRPPQPSQPGPNGGTPNPQANIASGLPNPRLQGPQHACPEMYTTSQHQQPGPPCTSHPHAHIPPHPFMYMPPGPHPQPPPMPPFLQYQWPMPFPYNPFAGFPAMGYGMGMPPFPPTPYLEAPGYMLPQPPLQQVNYRRLLHAQFPAASAPYQNQNCSSGGKQSHAAVENYATAGSDTEGNLLVGKMGSSEDIVNPKKSEDLGKILGLPSYIRRANKAKAGEEVCENTKKHRQQMNWQQGV
ncbi:hypothetical protein NHX12_003695 [Muraenolepis orangiensis]|uniref:Uncharacterized protein n=1 Tax=Muraenolepis orangiensis TaxID=630683 RepID=A0A9Q0IE15_9TELE|nr:hypothetical protein NHX12_003695 [Muraenolepis orangiensis]